MPSIIRSTIDLGTINQTGPGGQQYDQTVSSTINGNFIVGWYDSASVGIRAQLYNQSGSRIGGEFSIGPPNGNSPEFDNVSGGQLGIAYAYNGNIRVQRYSLDGNSLIYSGLDQIQTDAASQVDPSISGSLNGYISSYTTLGNNNYSRGSSVGAAVFNGTNITNLNIASGSYVSDQNYTNVGQSQSATLSNGNYIVVYASQGTFSPNGPNSVANSSAIQYSIFSPNGQLIQNSIVTQSNLVGSDVYDISSQPDITALTGGGFVISWTSTNSGTSDSDVRAAVYDVSSNLVRGEFIVNQSRSLTQNASSVVGTDDGGFMAAWSDQGGGAIAQSFDQSGVRIGEQVRIGYSGFYGPDSANVGGGRVAFVTEIRNFEDLDITGTLATVGNLASSDRPNSDLTGDGTSDIILQNGGSVVAWSVQNGRAVAGGQIGNAGGYTARATGDLNADGTSDILLQAADGSVVGWTAQNGQVTAGSRVGQAGAYSLVGSGDFNADGTDDVLLHNQANGSVVAWTVQNGQAVAGAEIGNAGSYNVVGTGDFNGDGTTDILLQSGASVVEWLVTGGRVTEGRVVGNAGSYTVAGVGDLNRDGTSDIVLQNASSVVEWLMGNGAVTSGAQLGNAGAYHVAAVGDYNGDGTADIALQNGSAVVGWSVQNGQVTAGDLIGQAGSYSVVG